MTMATDDSRLGALEGRVAEQSASMLDMRAGLRALGDRVDQVERNLNNRIDRLFLALIGIGAAQIGLLVTLVVRGG